MLDRTRDVADQARRIAGAVGYMTKAATGDEIGRAVHAAAAGQTVMDLAVQRKLLAAARRAPGSVTPPDVGLTGGRPRCWHSSAPGVPTARSPASCTSPKPP
ncbi:hypothetical protein GCM10022220_61550 [Actinocatenispora rupis]|uniref:Uncharacterized protein n=1 Tax=Actinocatenispora rupis TaxID=519421 RepID=A0A8J3JBL3_9ACTN|nr:hypothetical protein Aru02nite_62800 [Actinocatenispora rupis]